MIIQQMLSLLRIRHGARARSKGEYETSIQCKYISPKAIGRETRLQGTQDGGGGQIYNALLVSMGHQVLMNSGR